MGADIKTLRSRIKSVDSTLHLTKAMGLVASSKLRRAMEAMNRGREYENAVRHAIAPLLSSAECKSSPYMRASSDGKECLVVIAGDRGLAGGYNANIFRLTDALSKDKDAIFLPVGKKALDFDRHRGREIFSENFGVAAEVGVGDAFDMSSLIASSYREGSFGKVVLVYTRFVSMISQLPVYEELLPFDVPEDKSHSLEPLTEEDTDEMLANIVPYYVGGIIYSAICESLASESGARRSAMNAANKNAEEMINSLMLKYNRARQAIITQEITEIVSGAQS